MSAITKSVATKSGIVFRPLPTAHAQIFWNGGVDAHGMVPERHISDGGDLPCRHCLQRVKAGETYLALAYRPFETPQPYAEVGPIFLHAHPCSAYEGNGDLPSLYANGEPRIVRGYGYDERIIYGTGKVVPPEEITRHAADLLSDPAVKFVHLRSSTNNCFACRIERSEGESARGS
ncbi:MAG: DUF1203 domain-containing protein [Pseudomonadota bacterium]